LRITDAIREHLVGENLSHPASMAKCSVSALGNFFSSIHCVSSADFVAVSPTN
jgi:hypothetical protein